MSPLQFNKQPSLEKSIQLSLRVPCRQTVDIPDMLMSCGTDISMLGMLRGDALPLWFFTIEFSVKARTSLYNPGNMTSLPVTHV